jgi:cytochrome c-type biogenesis protein CcsB
MERITKALFSMKAMAVGLFIFLTAIAVATFIESSETTQASKVWIYNAKWFEFLLAFLTMNLIANIFRYQMWKNGKWSIFLYHLSFIVIILGAWITRYISYEGRMMVREGESSNIVYTSDPFLIVNVNNGKLQYTDQVKAYMAESYPFNSASLNIKFPGHPTTPKVRYVDFKSNQIDTIETASSFQSEVLDLVTDGMKSNYIQSNEISNINGLNISFSAVPIEGVNVYKTKDTLRLISSYPFSYIPMQDMMKYRQSGTNPPDSVDINVKPGEEIVFNTTTLYQFNGAQFVFKRSIEHTQKALAKAAKKDAGSDYLIVRVSDGEQSKEVRLKGGMNVIGTPEYFQLNGLNYRIQYGMNAVKTPFYIKCLDFRLDRYPGSDMASSFASDLQVLDTANKEFGRKTVFMNNVMDYGGYRFFQSSYDQDEKGTILSVNHDFWGTNVTYLGYLMMTLGMILSLFSPSSRFKQSLRDLKKSSLKAVTLLFIAMASTGVYAGNDSLTSTDVHNHEHEHEHEHETSEASALGHSQLVYFMSADHSKKAATLLVQDNRGRIIPLHTLCNQILRKLYRSDQYEGKDAVQVVMSMHMYPQYWMDQKVVLVPKAVMEAYKLNQYVSVNEMTNPDGNFKWIDDYNIALRKPESKQSETEKKLIKVGEKYQIMMMVLSWDYMKIIPLKNDPKHNWYMPFSSTLLKQDTMVSRLALSYISSINDEAKANGNFKKSDRLLTLLKKVQRQLSPVEILPTETHVNVEIAYNNMHIFKNVMQSYFMLSIPLLVIFFIQLLGEGNPNKKGKFWEWIRRILIGITVFVFIYHGVGLGMRTYVTGHAPWSDGYEAIVYIAWVGILGGLILSRLHKIVLPAAVIISSIMLMVTELNLLDPEITPLQPVLKSYWLMIHVAIITGSYAFLAISFILSIVNFSLYSLLNEKRGANLMRNINQISSVSQISMTIGLFMLTVGTFLGGVWANESWGRYWGWDPKETWALVSILVYAIIMHLHYIPGAKGKFIFNAFSMWGFSAIIFTFLGVNFILVGLHSYANGDGATELPLSVWITVFIFTALTVFAKIRYNAYIRTQKDLL